MGQQGNQIIELKKPTSLAPIITLTLFKGFEFKCELDQEAGNHR